MIRFLWACSVVCVLAVYGIGFAQSTPSMPEHHHHDDAPAPGEKLGQVSFPTTCASRSQPAMERGVALLHSFGYTIAQMQLRNQVGVGDCLSELACVAGYPGL
jgi:hypothetical protein